MILIFSEQYDSATTSVMEWLHYYGQKVIRINYDDGRVKFYRITPQGIFFRDTHEDTIYNFLDAQSCWWRRAGLGVRSFLISNPPKELVSHGIDLSGFVSGQNSLLRNEISYLKEYIFKKVYEHCHINIGSPLRYDVNKLIVSNIAREEGFVVPDYEVISNLSQIAKSRTIKDRFVTKAIANGIYGGDDAYHNAYSYTELYEKKNFPEDELVRVFPSLIMGLVEKKMEIRSFFLSGTFYSMAIFSQSSDQTKVDFRKYNQEVPNRCEPFRLPEEIEDKLRAVFHALDLNCGSVDLIINEKDEYVFLEINPVGQYGMVNMPCNYDLDKLIANYLIHGKTQQN